MPIARRRAPSPTRRRRTTRSIRGQTSELIYRELRGDIVGTRRAPQQPINEKEIASRYGVSRTPVREALLRLSAEGLVVIVPQSRTFVARIPVAALPETILIRKALEDITVRYAAQNADARRISRLKNLIDRQSKIERKADYDKFLAADEEFHATIAEVAGYPGVWRLVEQVKVQVDRYRRLTFPLPGRLGRVVGEHNAIVDGIAAHDPDRAAAAMKVHLDGLSSSLIDVRNLNPGFFDGVVAKKAR